MIPILQDVGEPTTFPLADTIDLPERLRFLQLEVFGNSLLAWTVAAVVLVLGYPLLRLLVAVAAGRLEAIFRRTPGQLGEAVATLLRSTRRWLLLIIALWLASLTLSPVWAARVGILAQVAVLAQMGLWAGHLLDWVLARQRDRRVEEDPGAAMAMAAIGFLGRIALWSVLVLMALASLGFEIGPALAGLGVGGIAVALALQNILGDLFASLSIIFDRPFVIGDFIIVGEQMGTVEHVGLKTTRVRSLSGEQLVFSNSDLLSARVRNFKRMDERRILFHFGVQYDTGHERLARIPEIVEEIVADAPNARFDRAHFAEFGDSSLVFEVVYFMTVPDFNSYRDTQQVINLELYRALEELGVQFAFPTRTLRLHVDGAKAELRTRQLSPEGDGRGAASTGEPARRRRGGSAPEASSD